jgi:hypothetical protein
MASIEPAPIIGGSIPTSAADKILAVVKPYFCCTASLPIINADLPSLIPDAFPAVTTPLFEGGVSFCKASKLELGRGYSSSTTYFWW